MANPNKKSKERKPMPENTEVNEVTTDTAETELVETAEEPKVDVMPVIAEAKEVNKLASPEELILLDLIKTYKDSIDKTQGLKRTPEHTINFIKICVYLIATDKMSLYELFYAEVFVNDPGKLMASSVVFQHLHNINATNKKKVELLYTALSALKAYLASAKKTSFPLDFAVLTEQYGGDNLVTMLKNKLNL